MVLVGWTSMLRIRPNSLRFAHLGRMSKAYKSTTPEQAEKEVYTILAEEEEDVELILQDKEAELERKRDKSRLNPQHRNMIKGLPPYPEPKLETHLTQVYQRKLFARYGRKSYVDPGVLWPDQNTIEEALELERVTYPVPLMETIQKKRREIEEEQRQINERQMAIKQNLMKLEQWKRDIRARVEKKAAAEAAVKAKKNAIIEEVRRQFGFQIDPKDERFQAAMAEKEKAIKKEAKEKRSKEKQQQLLASLMKQS